MTSVARKYKRRYDRGGCTLEQLHELVEVEILTPQDYKIITGDEYVE